VNKGDLLLFDRSLWHEVEATAPGTGANRGRCNVVMGGRQADTSALWAAYRQFVYTQPAFSLLWTLFGWRRSAMSALASRRWLDRFVPSDWRSAGTPETVEEYRPRNHVRPSRSSHSPSSGARAISSVG
jgi:hypothetical protein